MDIPDVALSIRQPWTWAIVAGHKDIENRGTSFALTREVRHIAIHASQGMTREEYEEAAGFMAQSCGVACPRPDDLIRGAIIGTATVAGVVDHSESRWFFGDRGLLIRDARPIEPIPCSGALGYFRWSPGGEIATPRPWMTAWPGEHKRTPRQKPAPQPVPMPLFGQ